MKIIENEKLDKYTTIKIGGTAKRFLVPESTEDLIEAVRSEGTKHLLGGGSNLLINDAVLFDSVISLREFNKEFLSLGNGVFKVGASVRLQTLINNINKEGYGGIEYLFSVPGLVGGAILMNAGRGKVHNQSIGDYVQSCCVLRDGQVVEVSRKECGFAYRTSAFKGSNDIVHSVYLKFPEQSEEENNKRKQERIDMCKQVQDNSCPNFGSVFCVSNEHIMKIVRKLGIGKKGYATFSKKTLNWVLKEKNGGYADVLGVMEKVEHIHRLFGRVCCREVIVWNE